MSENEIRGPGRPKRSTELQERRRRREDLGLDRNLKLHVPESFRDKNYEYRWVNDKPGRVQRMTVDDDWDIVGGGDPVSHLSSSEGTVIKRVVDSNVGEKAVLLRKRKDYYEQDKKKEQEMIAAEEEGMRRGEVKGPDALTGPSAYIPGGRNTITRG